MSTENPTFSVVFPTYNRCAVVERTLRHLVAQDYPHDRFEVIVCDNSSDDTPAMVGAMAAESPARIVLQSSNERLPAVKRNLGLRAATGDYVVYLNDDVWVGPSFLREHARVHAQHTAPIGVLGLVEQSPEMENTPFVEWYQPFGFHLIADRAGQHVPFWFNWSMNLSYPRATLLDRNLLFHEDWANIGHEDVELGYRWANAGYGLVYNPAAHGYHFHPHDLESACRLQESVGRGLRDLEALIPEPELLARYGIADRRAGTSAFARATARRALFNRFTVPPLVRNFGRRPSRSRVAEWAYWKLMLHYTDRGYRDAPARSPDPVPIRAIA